MNLGYHTILISDACAAATDQAHEATLATFSLLGRTATAAHIAAAFTWATAVAHEAMLSAHPTRG